MKMECALAVANKENLNGRIYSPEVFKDMITQFENNKPMFGELGTPIDSFVSIKNTSHKITSMRIERSRLPRKKKKTLKKQGLYQKWKNNSGSILFGTIELLDTEAGKLVKNMFDKCSAVVRPRGFGNVKDGKVENYSLISFDVIDKNEDSFNGLI